MPNELLNLLLMVVAGLIGGIGVSRLVTNIPQVLDEQWYREACETLGLSVDESPAMQDCSVEQAAGSRSRLRTFGTVLASVLIGIWATLHFGNSLHAVAVLPLGWGLLTLALIDYEHKLLPDVLVLPLLWLGLLVNSFGLFTDLRDALWGAVGGYILLRVLREVSKHFTGQYGIGLGDVKLLAMLGAWGGLQLVPSVLFLSAVAGVALTTLLLATGRVEKRTPIPFGPFLGVAGWLVLLYQAYLPAF
ncbi:A24 family peptidase [Pseudomonas sp. DCB_CB]|uniref:prepilin peptidase n=1 Tax=unclassified Pseudomonas TaxID=196821 RepID=UPI002249483E|nr:MULTISPECIES: A24 family peptidase [unclassified Pseudomonas]MCX2694491.1 A24 family peptidase [Pseudomonas sp. DCB_BZ]MCX2859679.1 A24 family peptidase [Pseudomonas sp. DCB_CB]